MLLPLPGYWVPLTTSPPSDLVPCPSPYSTTRCPGWSSIPSTWGAYGCGRGFFGQACSGCEKGYFRSSGTCEVCPSLSIVYSFVVPVVIYLSVLIVVGVLLVVALQFFLQRYSVVMTKKEVAVSVGGLLLMCFISGQGLASLFWQTRGIAPEVLRGLFQAVASLQFRGITLDPACYDSIPFQSFWVSLGVVCAAYFLYALTVCLLHYLPPAAKFIPSTRLLTVCGLVLTLAYGPTTGIFSSVVICLPSRPMSVADYVNAVSDGRSLSALKDQGAPTLSDLLTALKDPEYASASGLSIVLKSTIPVSVLASDPFQVCGEGPHATARPAAIFMTVFFTLGFPLLGLFFLWFLGEFNPPCLSKKASGKPSSPTVFPLWCFGGKKTPASSNAPTTASLNAPATASLNASTPVTSNASTPASSNASTPTSSLRRFFTLALTPRLDPSLAPQHSWVLFFEMFILAVITGCMAVADGVGLSLTGLWLAQAGVILARSTSILCHTVGGRHYLPEFHWKQSSKCSLHFVTAVTALLNGVLVTLGDRVTPGVSLGLSSLVIFLGFFVIGALLVAWWRSLFRDAKPLASRAARHKEEEGGGLSSTPFTLSPSPLPTSSPKTYLTPPYPRPLQLPPLIYPLSFEALKSSTWQAPSTPPPHSFQGGGPFWTSGVCAGTRTACECSASPRFLTSHQSMTRGRTLSVRGG